MKCEWSPGFFSDTARSAIDTFGSVAGEESTSSFSMVPMAFPSAIVALTGEDRLRTKFSLSSTMVSPSIETLMVFEVRRPRM